MTQTDRLVSLTITNFGTRLRPVTAAGWIPFGKLFHSGSRFKPGMTGLAAEAVSLKNLSRVSLLAVVAYVVLWAYFGQFE